MFLSCRAKPNFLRKKTNLRRTYGLVRLFLLHRNRQPCAKTTPKRKTELLIQSKTEHYNLIKTEHYVNRTNELYKNWTYELLKTRTNELTPIALFYFGNWYHFVIQRITSPFCGASRRGFAWCIVFADCPALLWKLVSSCYTVYNLVVVLSVYWGVTGGFDWVDWLCRNRRCGGKCRGRCENAFRAGNKKAPFRGLCGTRLGFNNCQSLTD